MFFLYVLGIILGIIILLMISITIIIGCLLEFKNVHLFWLGLFSKKYRETVWQDEDDDKEDIETQHFTT